MLLFNIYRGWCFVIPFILWWDLILGNTYWALLDCPFLLIVTISSAWWLSEDRDREYRQSTMWGTR